MTDYLEEHLGGAEALLEWIRRLEQSASGLSREPFAQENINNMVDFAEKSQTFKTESDMVSRNKLMVYNTKKEVNQENSIVDKSESGQEIREKGPDITVNHQTKEGDNNRGQGQTGTISGTEGTQDRAEHAAYRSPLSAQLVGLDRAVSALTTPVPESREAARGGYPISLSPPQGAAAGPITMNVPGGSWSGPDTAAGADFAYGGTQSWAEQADRMFRRDSRRYDGGFTLY